MTKDKKDYDLIIIGAGPAGLTAAIYAARYKLNILVIGQLPGGTAAEASEICNYPSEGKISGMALMQKMVKNVKDFCIEIKSEEVIKICKKKIFEIQTKKAIYCGKKVILASGTKRRKLGLEREGELAGKGISYCATCDAGFYKDKIAGVVGGGNSALTAALLLSKFAKQVFIFYRHDKFTKPEPAWVEEVEKNKKIKKIFNVEVKKFLGVSKIKGVELSNGETVNLDGVFIEIGSVPSIELAAQCGVTLEKNYIRVDKEQKTNVAGFFAAGDITNNVLKQIITACAEGAIAAQSAYQELVKGN